MSSQHSGSSTAFRADPPSTTAQRSKDGRAAKAPDEASLAQIKAALAKGDKEGVPLQYFVSVQTRFDYRVVKPPSSPAMALTAVAWTRHRLTASAATSSPPPGSTATPFDPSLHVARPAFVQVAFTMIPMNQLRLPQAVGSEFIIPGDQIEVNLDLANLTCPINGVQALMRYDTTFLELQEITLNDDPELGLVLVNASDHEGNLVYAAFVPGGAIWRDCTVATLKFEAIGSGNTHVGFRADEPVYKNKLTSAVYSTTITPNLVYVPFDVVCSDHPEITAIRMRPDQTDGQEGKFRIQVDTSIRPHTLQVTAVSNEDGAQPGIAEFKEECPEGTLNYSYEDATYGGPNP